jgi:hypothetical protein
MLLASYRSISTAVSALLLLSMSPDTGSLLSRFDEELVYQRAQLVSLDPAADTGGFYRTIGRLRTTAQLLLLGNPELNSRSDCSLLSRSVVDDLTLLSEYFSVSNDVKEKMMLGDAVPGQKRDFGLVGIDATRSDLRKLNVCAR